MGKFKKPRNTNRTDPTGKPTKPPSDPRILPVLQDLQSVELKKRSTAASLIANLVEDEATRKQLLRGQIVRILFKRTLCDSNIETRTAGWGILRKLALEEGADFCVHLYRQGVLKPLEENVKSIILSMGSRLAPFSNLPQIHQKLTWNLAGSIISLLTILSEAKDEIVDAITKVPALLNFPFGILALDTISVELEYEILTCLIAFTEDNKPVAEHLLNHVFLLEGLRGISNSGEAKAVPACGVLHNFFTAMNWYDHNTPWRGFSDAMIIPILVNAMEKQPNNGADGHSMPSSPDQVLQLAVEITASIATCLQEALEHGSRHEKDFEGFSDDEIDTKHGMTDENDDDGDIQEEDDEMGEDDKSMNFEEIEADMDFVTGDGPDEGDSSAEEVTLNRLVRIAAPKLLQLAQTDSHIQSYALSALNNLAWTVSSIDFSTGHLDSLQKAWSSLSQQMWNEIVTQVLASNTADIDLAASVTSLAWAVARSVQGVIMIQPGEHRKFMALYQASKGLKESEQNGSTKGSEGPGDAFQGLGVKAIGVLGRLALSPAPVELNREIGVFLLTVLSSIPATPAAEAVEALNQIFDIYADKSSAFDEAVFWEIGFYRHLEDVLPKAKKMAKSVDKRKLGELRARLDEAVINLGRFLKYKRTERREAD